MTRKSLQHAPGLLMVSLLALAALGASANAETADLAGTTPATPMKTICLLLPVEPGETVSKQWCDRALPATPAQEIIANAPWPFNQYATTSVTLGTDYDQWWMGGDSLEWYGANTCASGRSYIGNTPSWFLNRASSASIASGSGCSTFRHYDGAGQTGTSGDCTTSQNCEGTRLYIIGMDNKTESIWFLW